MKKIGRQGFASMSPEARSAIASKGGISAHAQGRAHKFTPEEAREAGKKGGRATSADKKHMSNIGRLGGSARAKQTANPEPETAVETAADI